ncbi:hypothetical protein MACA111363_11310 [Macrococcoides canis]|uniref:Uncharacterized protein n=1 Tax=Macrococcoides canis TaxID=1855823 RepID=A0A1W7ACL8_9STAP|nr:hypothetical protein MCCS_16870 [Macrococcus canis]
MRLSYSGGAGPGSFLKGGDEDNTRQRELATVDGRRI